MILLARLCALLYIGGMESFTQKFFQWAANNDLKTKDIAEELGRTPVVVSNWRSKSIPLSQHYACKAFMSKVAIRAMLDL